MKKSAKWAWAGAAVTGAGLLAWVQFRLYVRKEVLRVLNAPKPEGYDYDNTLRQNALIRIGGALLKIPSARVLAESAVPIWSTVHPYDAFDDILDNGRDSQYWPKGYQSALPEAIDDYIFKTLRAMNEAYAVVEQAKEITKK